jgi:hypothetical protein
LRVPSPTGDLEVRLELRFKADLTPSGAHGADAGPARFSLTGGGGKQWTATVDLDQHLDPKDVEFVLGHELDEISELVRRHPGGLPAAAMEREMSASVMRQGATSAAATAHDVAHAREVVALKKDYDNLVPTKSGNAPARKEVLDRAIEAAGLGDATQLEAKLRLLREAGAPEDLLHQVRGVEVRQVLGEHVGIMSSQGTQITEDLVDHVLWPRQQGAFQASGVNGGHHTRRLLDMAWPNSEYVFVETASKRAGTTVARRFEQYKWNARTPIPGPGSGNFPTDPNFNPTGWTKSEVPKTTFDDPMAMLREAEDAIATWKKAGAKPTSADGRGFRATTSSGIDISGFVEPTPNGPVVTTFFVEASWF